MKYFNIDNIDKILDNILIILIFIPIYFVISYFCLNVLSQQSGIAISFVVLIVFNVILITILKRLFHLGNIERRKQNKGYEIERRKN